MGYCSVCGIRFDLHPQCSVCGVLAGPGHVFQQVFGKVCGACVREPVYVPGACSCALVDGVCVGEGRELAQAFRLQVLATVRNRVPTLRGQVRLLVKHLGISRRRAYSLLKEAA